MANGPSPPEPRSHFQPFNLLLAGAGLMAVSIGVIQVGALPALLRVFPLLAGAALIFQALLVRLRTATWDTFPERVETAAFLAIAAAAAGANAFGTRLVERLHLPVPPLGIPNEWDAVQLFFAGAFLMLLSGTAVVLLPEVWRKVAISVWLVFHFLGMFVVFTSIDPPNAQGPWLSKQLWTIVYRPYLSFFYLTNAYHFYSPDPGPPALLWFAVKYEDGSYTWVKIPSRDKSPIGMHYQRLLALPEHTFSPSNRYAHSEVERAWLDQLHAKDPKKYRDRVHLDRVWDDQFGPDGKVIVPGIYRRRYNASRKATLNQRAYVFKDNGTPSVIPWVADVDLSVQYREPTDTSRRLIASVARRVLREAPLNDTGSKPRSVKAYRLVHNCLTPKELAEGKDPYSKNKYWAWFLGEFDLQRNTKYEEEMWPDYPLDTKDPFLYWYLPIAEVEEGAVAVKDKEGPRQRARPMFALDPKLVAITVRTEAPKGAVLLNCLEMHAAGDLLERERARRKEGK
jgi:hypothetical protein